MLSRIIVLFVLIFSCPLNFCFANESEKIDYSYNDDTKPMHLENFSTTPIYEVKYEMPVYELDVDCANVPDDSSKVEMLDKGSRFRAGPNYEVENDQEIIVDVYKVPQADKDLFRSPWKVCKGISHMQSKYRRVGGLSSGLLYVPFKFRDGDLYTDSLVGPYVSVRFQKIEGLLSVGLSQVSLSEVGTENVETRQALTGALGLSFELNKDWDIAILSGIDHLSGEEGDNWTYQDKPWMAFSIGYNFTRKNIGGF
jgi:hypothetical protein